jgi:hypothetical protein
MAADNWNAIALDMAHWVRANLVSAVREALIVTRDTEGIDVIVVFGGSNAGAAEQWRHELEQLRKSVHEAGYQELGNAQSLEHAIWTMVVESPGQSNQLSALVHGWLARTSPSVNHAHVEAQPSKGA